MNENLKTSAIPPEPVPQFKEINNFPAPQKKGHKLYFVASVILIALASVFLLWQIRKATEEIESQPLVNFPVNQFAGWKIYKNEEYGFEFKYPSDFFKETDDSKSIIILNNPKTHKFLIENSGTEYSPSFTMEWIINPKNLSPKEFFDGKNDIKLFDNPKFDREIKINGYSAYLNSPITSDGEVIIIPHEGYFLVIYGTNTDQILSTFKFIK